MVADAIEVRIENQLVRFVPPQPCGPGVSRRSTRRSERPVASSSRSSIAHVRRIVIDQAGQNCRARHSPCRGRSRRCKGIDAPPRTQRFRTWKLNSARLWPPSSLVKPSSSRAWLGTLVQALLTLTSASAAQPIVDDTRHNLTLHMWPNGRCVATDARHRNMVAMAAVYLERPIQSEQETSWLIAFELPV